MLKQLDFTKLPITEIVNEIIYTAAEAGASDIHFDPTETTIRVRFRIDGVLIDYTIIPENIRKNLLSKEIKYHKDKITELEDNISLDNRDEYSVMMKLRDDLLSRYEEIQSFDKSLAKLEGNTFDLNDGIIHNHQRVQTTADGEVLKILEKI